MTSENQNQKIPAAIDAQAAKWLACRDRGLTAAEHDEYAQWLRSDARHGPALARLENVWCALDGLSGWQVAHSRQPNPDLLASTRRWRGSYWSWAAAGLAAAAAVVLAFVVWTQPRTKKADNIPLAGAVHVIPGPERLVLADGSVVELRHGGKIETAFTPGERRVHLLRGEAHFKVAKNPARPFIVDADAVAVRAVGTVFDVRRGSDSVEVLVTEGKVRVERPVKGGSSASVSPEEPTFLAAGERAVLRTADPLAAPQVATVTEAQIDRELDWRGAQLEFAELPLSDVLAEFNLRNSHKVLAGDSATGEMLVSGRFRADNVDGFVRLLEASFGVTANRRPDGTIVLRLAK